MNELERGVPKDLTAEEAVLGSLLLDRDAVVKVAPFLRATDFWKDAHAEIYAAVLRLYERSEPPDFVTLCSELQRVGKLELVGGAPAIIGLIDSTPTSVHIEHYARLVTRQAYGRRLISAGGAIAQEGYLNSDDVEAVTAKVERILADATMQKGAAGITSIADAVAAFTERLEQLESGGGTAKNVGVPSGFVQLDNKIGGWQAGKLIVKAGRPGTGKTSLMLNEAKHAAKGGVPAGIFSLEMDRSELVARYMADEAQMDSRKFILGQYISQDEWRRLMLAEGRLGELPLYIDDTANLSISELRSKAYRMRAEKNIGILFVDYLQLVTAPRKDGNRVLEVGEVARKLKILARELDIPVIVGAQLNRAVEQRASRIPILSDLRDSGEIEQHADIVIFIHREELYGETSENAGVAELHIAKHRAGPLGIVPLRFVKERTQFQSITRQVERRWDDEA
jgi:replicative DNA helicase